MSVEEDEGRYGFAWGPLVVERMIHVPGRGYVVDIRPREQHETGVQVYVSEKGRSVKVYPRGGVKVNERTEG